MNNEEYLAEPTTLLCIMKSKRGRPETSLTSYNLLSYKCVGMYIGEQWAVRTKGYRNDFYLVKDPSIVKTENAGPLHFFQCAAFFHLTETVYLPSFERDHLDELTKDGYKDRLGCNNPKCMTSMDLDGRITCGTGKLDFNGLWEHTCQACTRLYR